MHTYRGERHTHTYKCRQTTLPTEAFIGSKCPAHECCEHSKAFAAHSMGFCMLRALTLTVSYKLILQSKSWSRSTKKREREKEKNKKKVIYNTIANYLIKFGSQTKELLPRSIANFYEYLDTKRCYTIVCILPVQMRSFMS